MSAEVANGYGGALAALLLELGYDAEDAACGREAAPLRADALDALFGLPSMRVQAFLEWFLASARPRHSVKRQLRGASEYALFLALARGEHGGLLSEEDLVMEEMAAQEQQHAGDSLDDLVQRKTRLANEVDKLERRLRLAEEKNARLAKLVQKQAARSDADAQAVGKRRRAQETSVANDSVAVRSALVLGGLSGRNIDVMVQHLGAASFEYGDDAVCGSNGSEMHVDWREFVYQQSLATLLDTERANLEHINTDIPKILAAIKKQEETQQRQETRRQTAWFFHNIDPQQLQLQEQDIYVYNRCCVELARLEKAFVSSEYDALMAQLELARASERQKQVRESRHRLHQQYELMSVDGVTAQHKSLTMALTSTRKQLAEYQERLLPRAFEEMAFLKTTTVLVGSYEQKLWRQERRFLQLRVLVDALDLQYGRLRLTHRLLDEEYAELKHVEQTLGYLFRDLAAANARAQERLQAHVGDSSLPSNHWSTGQLPTTQLARSSIKDTDEVAHAVFTCLEHITCQEHRKEGDAEGRSSAARFRTFNEMARLAERASANEMKLRDNKQTLSAEWYRVFTDKRSALDTLRKQLFGDATSATPLLVPGHLSTAVQEVVQAKDKAEADMHAALEELRIRKRSLAMDPSIRGQQQAGKERLRSALASR